jgi:hypothetical protein
MVHKQLSIVFLLLTAVAATGAEPIDIGSRLEPLVDDYLIETSHGVALTLHEPVAREVALVHDRSWEGNCCAYHTVFQDGGLYRMYYRAADWDSKKQKELHDQVICYAESKDGIHWTKPDVGLIAFAGSKRNNIVLAGDVTKMTHNFAPFKDANPKCRPEQRYKAVCPGPGGALQPYQSPDGFRWSLIRNEPIITKGRFDSLNLVFWDTVRHRYVEFHRDFRAQFRDIRTSTSSDFLHWTEPVWLEYPGAAREQMYTNAITAYARAPHIFFGFPKRFVANRRLVPDVEIGLSDCLFMTSRDGVNFHRWGEALIRPGLQHERWVDRNNMTAWGILITKSSIPGTPDELSIYSTENYDQAGPCRIRRFTVRLDGFVSMRADSRGGGFVTRPIRFAGKNLEMNYSTSAAGSMQVEIQDAAGKPISGFALDDCPETFGDRIDQPVTWKQGGDLSEMAGQQVRLRFVMKDADLYAIRFR